MKTQGFIYHSFILIMFLRVFLVRYCLLRKHAVSMLFGEKSETLEDTLGEKILHHRFGAALLYLVAFSFSIFSHICS